MRARALVLVRPALKEPRHLVPGSVAVLRSGSPPLRVEAVGEKITCSWDDGHGGRLRTEFGPLDLDWWGDA